MNRCCLYRPLTQPKTSCLVPSCPAARASIRVYYASTSLGLCTLREGTSEGKGKVMASPRRGLEGISDDDIDNESGAKKLKTNSDVVMVDINTLRSLL